MPCINAYGPYGDSMNEVIWHNHESEVLVLSGGILAEEMLTLRATNP